MTYSENVNKPFNNILMLDSDLLIKMCIKENNGGTSVCVIGMAGFMLHPGLFCSCLSVCEHGRVSSGRHRFTHLSPTESVFPPTGERKHYQVKTLRAEYLSENLVF